MMLVFEVLNLMKSSVSARHYDYSPAHRALEITAIALCCAMLIELARGLASPLLAHPSLSAWLWLIGAGFVGYLCADLVSGIVHWLADRFGSPQTPVLGQSFIHPFREHHDFPDKILEHDFVEVNGNNCVAMLFFLVPVTIFLPQTLSGAALGFASFSFFFSWGIFLTNQFHCWAHADEVPAPVALLQRSGLILSKHAHDRHHTAPYETDYCITSGWMNPLLERYQVFPRLERLLGRAPSEPADEPRIQTS